MRKDLINKYLKKFGVELHGSGYINKLVSQQQNKNSFQAQAQILNNEAAVIFDIGANKGLITSEYLRYFPKAVIHAFEPFAEHFALWEKIIVEHDNVHFNPVGIFDKKGRISFNVNNNHDTNSIFKSTKIGATSDNNCTTIGEATIDVITIDDYCLQNRIDTIDILKLDTQGSELAALKGAEKMLVNKQVRLIFCETYFKQQYIEQPLMFEIAQYLKQCGYYIQDMYEPFYNDQLLLWCDTIFIPERKN